MGSGGLVGWDTSMEGVHITTTTTRVRARVCVCVCNGSCGSLSLCLFLFGLLRCPTPGVVKRCLFALI